MHIVVVGVGAVGGFFGSRLTQAGANVTFVARGETLRVLRADGLHVESIEGDVHLPRVRVVADPADAGPADAVLVAVKAGQVAELAPTLRALLVPHTVVVPLQNSVEAAGQLAEGLGETYVASGFCRIIAQQVAPGRIRHSGAVPTIVLGTLPDSASASPTLAALKAALRQAGIRVEEPPDVRLALWEKFLFVVPFGTVGAAARSPIGELLRWPETRAALAACVAELVAVGAAQGVALTADSAARVWELYEQMPPGATTSMQRDLLAGRPSELEAQPGAVMRLGHQAGIATPVFAVLYAVLYPQEYRARQPSVA